jgi:predicted ester cyclase
MAPEENKSVVERFLMVGFAKNDPHTVREVLAPNFVNHDPPDLPGAGGTVDGVIAAIEYLHRAFSNAGAEIVRIQAEGDKVGVHDRLLGTHTGDFMGVAATGRDIAVNLLHVFRVVDGRIVERWGVGESAVMLEQLGITPKQITRSATTS